MAVRARVETAVRAPSQSGAASRIALLVLLFSASALYEARQLSALSNVEVWLHLRTGQWILQNHAIPHSGIFSQHANLPWVDSSWGFDVLLAVVYRLLGLRAIPIALMGLKVGLAVVVFLVARAARAGFWTAVFLSAVAQYVIPGLQPSPAAFSILCFGVELAILMRCRLSGDPRFLFWLPPLFLLWANLHIQFVCGLVVLALFVLALWAEQLLNDSGADLLDEQNLPVPVAGAGVVAGVSLVATFLTPYSFHLAPSTFQALYSDVAFEHFAEMRSLSFRRPQDFLLMLLVMAAFLALGRGRRLRLFEVLLLIAGTAAAFRIQRDGWLTVLPAVAILGEGFRYRGEESAAQHGRDVACQVAVYRWEKPVTAILVALIFTAAQIRLPLPDALLSRVSRNFPVKACYYISQNHLPEPLFNAYPWGGFLIWYLPQYPVAIDSRVELYGDQTLTRYFDVTGGKERMDSDPTLASARTLLLERQSGMAKALTTLPALSSQYRLVYSDDLAAVFVRQ
jgi:hypothetical protein